MKRTITMIVAFMAILAIGCTDSDSQLYYQLPGNVSKFVSQYFPGQKIASYTPANGKYTLVVDNGPTIVFDSKYQWISVDGNGSVLPQVLLFDQLPPSVYEYLQDTSSVGDVFSISRNSKVYQVKLLESSLTYNIATGEIS